MKTINTKDKRTFGVITSLVASILLVVPYHDVNAVSDIQVRPQQGSQIRLATFIEDEKHPQRKMTNKKRQDKKASNWAFYLDNDLFASTGKDRDYTGGMSLTLSGSKVANYTISIDPVLGVINNWLGLKAIDDNALYSTEFGLTAFTPEDTQAKAPIFDDRPYASLVYLSNTRQHVNLQTKSSLISSLTFGVLGLNVASAFQNSIHKTFGSDQAKGWDNQISEGGEFTFRYSLSKQTVQFSNYSQPASNYEVQTANSLSVGYLTEVSWSLSSRLGRIRSPFASFNPQTVAYAEKNLPLAKTNATPKNELYFWSGISLRLRAYNAFLQGQFRDSAVTYNSGELNHLIGEAWVGVTGELPNGYRLSYFVRGQSAEIKKGPGSRSPVWGGIIVSHSI